MRKQTLSLTRQLRCRRDNLLTMLRCWQFALRRAWYWTHSQVPGYVPATSNARELYKPLGRVEASRLEVLELLGLLEGEAMAADLDVELRAVARSAWCFACEWSAAVVRYESATRADAALADLDACSGLPLTHNPDCECHECYPDEPRLALAYCVHPWGEECGPGVLGCIESGRHHQPHVELVVVNGGRS